MKRNNRRTMALGFFAAAIFIAANMASIGWADITTGLTSHWTFSEAGGNTMVDTSGKGNDATENAYPPMVRISGSSGHALKFTGTGLLTSSPLTNFISASTGTISLWFNATDGNAGDCRYGRASALFTDGNTPDNIDGGNVWVSYDGKNLCAGGFDNTAGNHSISTSVSQGNWNHVAWTHGNGALTLYVNGVMAGSTTLTDLGNIVNYNPVLNVLNPVWVGQSFSGHSFYGDVANVRTYDRALSTGDVADLYAAESPLVSDIALDVTLASNHGDGANIIPGTSLTLTATISGSAVPDHVNFYNHGVLLGSAASNPYTFTVNNPDADTLDVLTAVSVFPGNVTYTSNAIYTVVGMPQSLAEGLSSLWKFNESTGTVVGDSSGQQNNGALTGYRPPQWLSGAGGHGLQFRGAGNVGNASIQNFVDETESSISVWFNAKAGNSGDCALGRMSAFLTDGTLYGGYVWLGYDGKNLCAGGADASLTNVNVSTPVSQGVWTHAVWVHSGGVVTLYVNGAPAASAPLGPLGITTLPAWTGISYYGNYYSGNLANFRTYYRGLSAAEVAALYALEAPEVADIPLDITLTSPLDGSNATASSTLSLTASVSNAVSSVQKVSFFDDAYGSTPVGTDLTNPYTATISNPTPHQIHTLKAVLTDGNGNKSTSNEVRVAVDMPLNLADGLQAYLTMDHEALDNGYLVDSSGNGNDAFPARAPQFFPGRVNDAMSFDGQFQYAYIRNVVIPSSFTLAAWVRVVSGGTVISIGNSMGSYQFTAGDRFYLSGSNMHATSTNIIPAHEWTHGVVTYNGSTVTFYVNGVAQPDILISTAPSTFSPSGSCMIGAYSPYPSYGYFKGWMDDVRVYNRVLSAGEIQDIYNLGLTPPVNNGTPLLTMDAPPGDLAAGTGSTTLVIGTDKNAACRWSHISSTTYDDMSENFTDAGNEHSTPISVTGGHNYFYVRCRDDFGNTNTEDFIADVKVYKDCRNIIDSSHYVATNGDELNCGTLTEPWDILTGLGNNTDPASRNSNVKPGDTVYLRGGDYEPGVHFPLIGVGCALTGTESQYVTVRAYQNERAVLWGSLGMGGEYSIVQDLEFSHHWGRYMTAPDGNPARFASRQDFEEILGFTYPRTSLHLGPDNTKAINNLLHDDMQSNGGDGASEWYGNITIGNGVNFENGTVQGDDCDYVHNDYSDTLWAHYDNNVCAFTNDGASINMWAAIGGIIRNMTCRNNIGEYSMIGARAHFTEVHDIMIENNVSAGLPSRQSSIGPGYGKSSTNRDFTIRNNLILNGLMDIRYNFSSSLIEDNTIVGDTVVSYKYSLPENVTMRNNTYYTKSSSPFRVFNQWYNLKDYSTLLGLDQTSTVIDRSYPLSNDIRYFPNKYEPGRMSIFVANYEMRDSVELDLSQSGIKLGQPYELRYIDNYFGPKITGVYDGSKLVLPMKGWTTAQPAYVAFYRSTNHPVPDFENPSPLWGTFLLLPTNGNTIPISSVTAASPIRFESFKNVFNPAIGEHIDIRYTLNSSDHASLIVYDHRGELVATLTDEDHYWGTQTTAWDGRNMQGSTVASGVYILILKSNGASITTKIVVVK